MIGMYASFRHLLDRGAIGYRAGSAWYARQHAGHWAMKARRTHD